MEKTLRRPEIKRIILVAGALSLGTDFLRSLAYLRKNAFLGMSAPQGTLRLALLGQFASATVRLKMSKRYNRKKEWVDAWN
jgi:hypothetical protein